MVVFPTEASDISKIVFESLNESVRHKVHTCTACHGKPASPCMHVDARVDVHA